MESASARARRIPAQDRETLLHLARATLRDYLGEGRPPACRAHSPALLEQRATFVTLRHRDSGRLRGCRGESRAQRPLVESVAYMAIAAATDDPRFAPVTMAELDRLAIEISVLTPMAPIAAEDVVPGRHGLMIARGPHAALLLPQAPVIYHWGREEYLQCLCRKAGLPEDAWRTEPVELYAFEAEVWGEEA